MNLETPSASRNPLKIIAFTLLSAFFAMQIGCINVKAPQYYKGIIDSANTLPLRSVENPEQLIAPGDFLQIRFVGKSPEVTAMINNFGYAKAEGQAGGEGQSFYRNGIEVERDGTINLPLIGRQKVAGLTRTQLREQLTKEASKILNDPIVTVAGARYRFSVIGEVRRSGTLEIEQEKISVLEALARSADISDYAQLSKVKIFRDYGGKREIVTLNLEDTASLHSPYFYVQNNDVIYVPAQPEKAKFVRAQANAPMVGRITGIVGALVALINLVLILGGR